MKRTLRTLIAVIPVAFIVLILSQFGFAKKNPENPMNFVDASGNRQGRWIITAAMMKYCAPWTPEQIVMEGEYKDSYRVGTWKEYHSDGSTTEWTFDTLNHHLQSKRFIGSRLVAETNYRYTVRKRMEANHFKGETWAHLVPREYVVHEGVAKTYYNDGTLLMEMTWNDGRLDGPMKTYYPDGRLCEDGIWKYTWWESRTYHHRLR